MDYWKQVKERKKERMTNNNTFFLFIVLVKIRKNGYSIRRTFADFYGRFRVFLSTSDRKKTTDPKVGSELVLNHFVSQKLLTNEAYCMGKTKVFFKEVEVKNRNPNKSINKLKNKIQTINYFPFLFIFVVVFQFGRS